MFKHPLFVAVPSALAILLVLTPPTLLPTVSIAAGAVTAAAIGIVLAWNMRPGRVAFGRGQAFHIVQCEPVPGVGQLLAVRFNGRVLLIGSSRAGCNLLAATVADTAGTVVPAEPTTTVADHRQELLEPEYEIPRAPIRSKEPERDPLEHYRALSGRLNAETTA